MGFNLTQLQSIYNTTAMQTLIYVIEHSDLSSLFSLTELDCAHQALETAQQDGKAYALVILGKRKDQGWFQTNIDRLTSLCRTKTGLQPEDPNKVFSFTYHYLQGIYKTNTDSVEQTPISAIGLLVTIHYGKPT